MSKILSERVGFAISDVERLALRMMSVDEDSEASLLRSLIRDEARRRKVWKLAVEEIRIQNRAKKTVDKFLA